MRWLFHVRLRGSAGSGAAYRPASLDREGFIHASFASDVLESARLYFPADASLEVLQIDPRRLDVRVEIARTPRGAMPHIHGPIPGDAIRSVIPLAEFRPKLGLDEVQGTRFAFVAFEGMTLLDLVGVYDPLSRIRSMGIDESSACEIVGAHGNLGWGADGARLEVSRVRPPLDGFDVVVIPGGFATRALVKDAPLLAWLKTFPENRLMASVCTGALLLGAIGRLRGRRATTHHSALAELGVYGATVVRERVVDAGQVVTAGGVTSGLDLGVYLARRLSGEAAAERIAAQMEWDKAGSRADPA
jgi:cyclohexyl-isocyanide hydratase